MPLTQAWRKAFDVELYTSGGVKGGNLLASVTLLVILVVAMVLVVSVIVLPLRPAIRDTGKRLAITGTAYFLLLGLGFMMVEIALLQRLSLFLGHPVYSLSIVLFGIILSTGLGSLISEKAVLGSASSVILWAGLLAIYLAGMPWWMPGALAALESAIAVAIIAPAGLLMGFGLPTGMRIVLQRHPSPAPWFWGINGAAGVLGSILAVAIGIAIGIDALLVLGAVCYAALAPAAIILQRQAAAGLPAELSQPAD